MLALANSCCSNCCWIVPGGRVVVVVEKRHISKQNQEAHPTLRMCWLFLAPLLLAASGAYCVGDCPSVCLSVCLFGCMLSNFFKLLLLIQFFSDLQETWHYTTTHKTVERIFKMTNILNSNLDLVSGTAAAEQSRLTGLPSSWYICHSRVQCTTFATWCYA